MFTLKYIQIKNTILSVLVSSFMICEFASRCSGNYIFSVLLILISIALAFVISIGTTGKIIYDRRKIDNFVLIILLLFLFQLVKFTFNPSFIVLLSVNYVLLFSVLNSRLYSFYFAVNFIVFSSFVFLKILNGSNLDEILYNGSRNVVSVVLMINLMLYHYIQYKNNENISIYPCVILFFISLLLMGRGGIVSSVVYLVAVLCIRLSISAFSIKTVFSVFWVVLMFFVFLYYVAYFEVLLDALLRGFEERGAKYSEDPRSLMFSNYISNVKFIDFFFGYNFYNDRYFNSLNFNPHNSFICLHYHIGIFTLPFLLFLICRLFYLLKYNRFLCVLVALICFRAWVDSILFIGPYDFVLFLFLLDGNFITNKCISR